MTLAQEMHEAWLRGYQNGWRDVPPPAPGTYRWHRSPTRMRTAYINGWRSGRDARARERAIGRERDAQQQ